MEPQQPLQPGDPRVHSGRLQRRSASREIFSLIGVLIAALIVAGVLILYVFQSYQVDGPSMQNTLHNNDRLIVWKLPRTWARITGHQYVPKRGDIIVFTESGLSQYGQANTKQLIKRVIGLPGDRVVVAHDTITIYNKQHPKGFQPDKTLPYGKAITEPAEQDIDITLGPHQLYVCGDNRTDSLDSRFFGPINTNQIIGKLAVRILPLDKAERF
ncbi:MAG TPA: signal peptidase I [Candidatus Saccharimonadales bacterium]